jgi:Domain of unknown function (DUF4388)
MLIAGSFREYPFYLLLEIFQRRRETGVLEITSSQESGYFYIKNGKVKDGQIGKSKGAAAVKSVAGLNDGSFRFKSLEPTDYARVVWQQSFGPTRLATEQPTQGSVFANLLGSSQFHPTFRLTDYDLGSSAQRAFRQFLPRPSTAYEVVKKSGLFLPRQTVAFANAGFAHWKTAQVGRRILLPIDAIRNTLNQFLSVVVVTSKVSKQFLALFAQRALHQFLLDMSAAFASLQKVEVALSQQTVDAAAAASALWRRAQVWTTLLSVASWLLVRLRNETRRHSKLEPKHRRVTSVPVSLLTIPKRTPIALILLKAVKSNAAFAVVMVLLWGLAGVMLYQIVSYFPVKGGITVDTMDLETPPANVARTKTKSKKSGNKRSTEDRKSKLRSAGLPGASLKAAPTNLSEGDAGTVRTH